MAFNLVSQEVIILKLNITGTKPSQFLFAFKNFATSCIICLWEVSRTGIDGL